MAEWKECSLESVCARLSSGKGISAKLISDNGSYPVYGGNGIRGYTDTSNFAGDCAIVGRQGAYCGNVRYFKGEAYMTEHAVVVCANEDNCTRYLAYLLSTMNLGRLSGQSAQPGLSVKTLGKQEIRIPEKEVQIKCADLLGSFDEKISHNEEVNKNLLQQARAMYKNRFVDLTPFGGSVPTDWHLGTVSEIIELHDSKRIPLSSRERADLDKIYPYYGATSVMDYVDRYLFDGIYLLLGEDGTVVDASGFPILQYVEGKFWVNNHAHIITGKNGFTVELLYLLFSLTNVQSIVTGAVQPKISQANLNKVPVVIPSEAELKDFDESIQPFFAEIRNLRAENDRLSSVRDSLLPRLMSGELDVSDLDL